MKIYTIAFIMLLMSIGIGCSNSEVDPIRPIEKFAVADNSLVSNPLTVLWGMWDIRIDLETLSATVMPDRNVENHFNVLPFLSPPKCSDCLKLKVNSYNTVTGILDVDVTLRNKFSIDGYDVRGILFTDSLSHMLSNDNGWTALFDIPGGDGINPFIAFAGDPQRKFPGKAELTEEYLISVPTPPKFMMIKYAVDASYPGNCLEPYAFENFTQSKITSEFSSYGTVNIDVKDWQGDVDAVTLWAPFITGEPSTSLAHKSGDTWSVDLINNMGLVSGDYLVEVTATSTGSGTTALYDYVSITISDPDEGGWAKTWGGSLSEYGNSLVMNGSSSVYLTGNFYSTPADFNPDPTAVDLHSPNGEADVFLSSFYSSGTYVKSRTWGGSAYDGGRRIAVDGTGNLYVTGEFYGTSVDFDPDPTKVDIHSSNGEDDIFISKFDSSGNLLWARTWGGNLYDWGDDIYIDESGNVYVTGTFTGASVDFDPDPTEVDQRSSNSNSQDVFVSEFDSSGTFKRAITLGGSESDNGVGVALDESGNIYIAGNFNGTVDFDPDPSSEDFHSAIGSEEDVFLSKFDSSGIYVFTRTWGSGFWDLCYSLDMDVSGNLYLAGAFDGPSVDFDPDPVAVDFHSTNGGFDAFVSKFNSAGVLIWARTWGGSFDDWCYCAAVDGSGNVYVTGEFMDTADFDPDPIATDPHSSNGQADIYLSKFDSSGILQWARTWGGGGKDEGYGVDVDVYGNAYVTGLFLGSSVDFNPDPVAVDLHSSNGEYDAFLCKFLPDGSW
jgi:hypothetical protein